MQSVKICGYAFNMSCFGHAMRSIIMRWSCQVFLFFYPSISKVIGILGESEVEHRDYIDLVFNWMSCVTVVINNCLKLCF